MRDLYSNVVVVEGINPIVMTVAVGAKNTGSQDLQGFDGAVVAIHVGAKHASDTLSGTNKITALLEHADDDGTGAAGSYSNVAETDVVGVTPASGVVYTIDAAGKCEQVFQCGYVGGKRFIRLTLTPAGTIANGVPLAVEVLKGFPNYTPAQ
jgi:hypothetical protein